MQMENTAAPEPTSNPARQIGNFTVWLVAALLVKALLFSVLIPPWLGNDEPNHFEYVLMLATGKDSRHAQSAIIESLNRTSFWKRAEMPSPPPDASVFDQTALKEHSENFLSTRSFLYYWLAALPVRVLQPEGTELKLLAARMVSVLLFMATMHMINLSARKVFSGSPSAATLAVIFAGFHPQFSYISSVVNADVLLIFLFSVVFFWLLVLADNGSATVEWTIACLGLTGISLLVKNHAVILFPIILLSLAASARGLREGARSILLFVMILVPAILLMEICATVTMIKIIDRLGIAFTYSFSGPKELMALSAGEWLRGFGIMFVTWWFTYGQMVYKQSFGFYALYAGISALLIIGIIKGLSRLKSKVRLLRHLLIAVIFLLSVVGMNVITFFSHELLPRVSGRYLFYAMAPISLLAGFGAKEAASWAKRFDAEQVFSYIFFVLNLIAIFGYLVPLYG